MSVFDDREKAFETKFKLDEENLFKLNARAVKIFGLWAAAQLQLEGADAEAYAQSVIEADFEEAGNHDFLKKVQGDFANKAIDMTIHHLENEFNACRDEAARQLFPAA